MKAKLVITSVFYAAFLFGAARPFHQPSPRMTRHELLAAAERMQVYAETLAAREDDDECGDCNEMELPATPENIELVKNAYMKFAGGDPDAARENTPPPENGKIVVDDWVLANYLSEQLFKQAAVTR